MESVPPMFIGSCCMAIDVTVTVPVRHPFFGRAQRGVSIVPTLWGFNIANWKITMINGKIHYESPFSIAMLNYQRVHNNRAVSAT